MHVHSLSTYTHTHISGGCDGEAGAQGILSGLAEDEGMVLCEDCTRDSTCSPCTVCLDGEVSQ